MAATPPHSSMQPQQWNGEQQFTTFHSSLIIINIVSDVSQAAHMTSQSTTWNETDKDHEKGKLEDVRGIRVIEVNNSNTVIEAALAQTAPQTCNNNSTRNFSGKSKFAETRRQKPLTQGTYRKGSSLPLCFRGLGHKCGRYLTSHAVLLEQQSQM